MQLFITDYRLDGNKIIISEKRIIHQLKNVLRAKSGYEFEVQGFDYEGYITRYQVRLKNIEKDLIETEIIGFFDLQTSTYEQGMIVSLPNKFDKIELIVQKLTEIGVKNIIFWKSERSIISDISDKRKERIHKISVESLEQSKGTNLPCIQYMEDISDFIKDKSLVVFDFLGEDKFQDTKETKNIFGVVGPEGGLNENDYETLSPYISKNIKLGDTILRMETATIIAGYGILNL